MKTLKKILLVFIAVIFLFPTLACLNEYNKDILGGGIGNDYPTRIYNLNRLILPEEQDKLKKDVLFSRNFEQERIRELEEEISTKKQRESGRSATEQLLWAKSNYAVQLLRLGETKEALTVLEKLAVQYPKEYNVLANLGTAYELAGQDLKALDLLRKAVTINSKSHGGSEWIHLKVLEAKIAIKTNPLWLQQNSVLGLDFEKKAKLVKNEAQGDTIHNFISQLQHQLEERMYFIKPKDIIVGDLLMLLGDTYGLYIGVKYALQAYKLAKEYTVSDSALLEKRLEEAAKMVDLENVEHAQKHIEEAKEEAENKVEKKAEAIKNQKIYKLYYIFGGLFLLIAFICGYVFWKKNRLNAFSDILKTLSNLNHNAHFYFSVFRHLKRRKITYFRNIRHIFPPLFWRKSACS